MDILNDYYPLNGPNPAKDDMSDSEISENEQHVTKLRNLNDDRYCHKRKKEYCFDDWCTIYSDDLWYLWGIISEFRKITYVLDKLDYPEFCDMCYQNSTKK